MVTAIAAEARSRIQISEIERREEIRILEHRSKRGSQRREPLRRPAGVVRMERETNLMVDGAAGEEIDQIVHETPRLPQAVAEKIGQMMQWFSTRMVNRVAECRSLYFFEAPRENPAAASKTRRLCHTWKLAHSRDMAKRTR